MSSLSHQWLSSILHRVATKLFGYEGPISKAIGIAPASTRQKLQRILALVQILRNQILKSGKQLLMVLLSGLVAMRLLESLQNKWPDIFGTLALSQNDSLTPAANSGFDKK